MTRTRAPLDDDATRVAVCGRRPRAHMHLVDSFELHCTHVAHTEEPSFYVVKVCKGDV